MNNKLNVGKAELEKTNFKSRSTKMIRIKQKAVKAIRMGLWYVIAMGVTFTALTTTLLAKDVVSSIPEPIKPLEASFKPSMPIEEYVFEEVKRELGLHDAIKAVSMIGGCENKTWDIEATYNNGVYGIDRGLWQINSKYHSEVSWECAYNAECSTKEAIRIIKERGFKEWTCGKKLEL